MLEELYRKHYLKVKPSDELEDETLGLMKEARDHGATMPQKPARWRLALAISASLTATAAAVAVIFVGVWMHRNSPVIDDTVGSLDSVVINDDLNKQPDSSDGQEKEPQEDLADTETKAPETPENESQTDSNTTEDGDQKADEQTPAEDAAPEDEIQSAEDDLQSSDSSDFVSNADPLGPDYVHNNTTRTYYSIGEFLNKLTAKETPGYGKYYYNARNLIIVPSALPDGARFRHLHLYTETGKYSYSYVFSKDNKDFILDIEVDAKTPKTLRDLRLQQEKISTETVQTGNKDNQMAYLFGENDYVLITVTEVMSSSKLTQEQTAELLTQFMLERCTPTNTIINMVYQS